MSTTPSDDLVLTDNEFGLFELMRDGVISEVSRSTMNNGQRAWICSYMLEGEKMQLITSYGSALDAFMRARVEIITAKIEGKQIYCREAIRKRKELGLS